YGLPGMVKLHGSVVVAGAASLRGANALNGDPDRNGGYTVISNMNETARALHAPVKATAALVGGATAHDALLKALNPYVGGKTPVIPELDGGPGSRGWLAPGYWNDGQEAPLFNAGNGLEFRVLRVADGSSPFDGFDQVFIRNTNAAGNIENVSIIVGVNVAMLIDGELHTAGVLEPGQTWSTTVPAGAYVNVPGASGDPGDGPTAQFIATPTSGARNLVVQFVDQSDPGTEPITSWLWNFNDGYTSTEQNPVHTFTSAGVYTVSLTVQTSVGISIETKGNYITVTDPVGPTALFTSGPTSIKTGDTVYFGDLSQPGSMPITAWAWDFGDGQTSADQSPSHAYTAAGVYTVTLTVTTSAGTDEEVKADLITVSDPNGPVVDFTASPTLTVTGTPIQFADLTLPGDAPLASWQWDFGDGAQSLVKSPVYAYPAPGVYSVTVTVTDTNGLTGVLAKPDFIVVSAPNGPTADFTAAPTTGLAPLTTQFVDLSLPGGAPVTTWEWVFGDGQTSNLPAPEHTYAAAGAYSVSLTVTTAIGTSSVTKPNFVVVTAPGGPAADFTAYPTTGKGPLTVQFANLSTAGSAGITQWAWTFGDGQTSTEQSPRHTYGAQGSFPVTLTVTDANANTSQVTKVNYVVVSAPTTLTAAFTSDVTSGTAPLTVMFTDQSIEGQQPITGRLWNFGDGETSTVQNPVHIYTESGNYTVTLTVSTASGSDAETKPAYISVGQGVPAAGAAGLVALAAALGLLGARRRRK
ncbi:MAG TPA: PKD domain-containing protein, partial [Candidatus Hydrogenedentes bacterium]|nr:PKD domain-containing protein [Candidatus Hydrogenedentota bacterium]